MTKKINSNNSSTYKNPGIYVNVCIPYDDYVMAKERGLNISEAARTGVKEALGVSA